MLFLRQSRWRWRTAMVTFCALWSLCLALVLAMELGGYIEQPKFVARQTWQNSQPSEALETLEALQDASIGQKHRQLLALRAMLTHTLGMPLPVLRPSLSQSSPKTSNRSVSPQQDQSQEAARAASEPGDDEAQSQGLAPEATEFVRLQALEPFTSYGDDPAVADLLVRLDEFFPVVLDESSVQSLAQHFGVLPAHILADMPSARRYIQITNALMKMSRDGEFAIRFLGQSNASETPLHSKNSPGGQEFSIFSLNREALVFAFMAGPLAFGVLCGLWALVRLFRRAK